MSRVRYERVRCDACGKSEEPPMDHGLPENWSHVIVETFDKHGCGRGATSYDLCPKCPLPTRSAAGNGVGG